MADLTGTERMAPRIPQIALQKSSAKRMDIGVMLSSLPNCAGSTTLPMTACTPPGRIKASTFITVERLSSTSTMGMGRNMAIIEPTFGM